MMGELLNGNDNYASCIWLCLMLEQGRFSFESRG